MTKLQTRWSAVFLSILLTFCAQVGLAAEVKGLYKASVMVDDRSESARRAGVKAGLAQVLVRVSGSAQLVGQESVTRVLESPERFVVQFAYHSKSIPSPEDGLPVKAVFLNVSFDETAVNQFLRREGYPIWASSRPNIVLWSAVRGPQGRDVVGGESQAILQQALLQHAERRGLPLIIPKFDAEDRSQVRAGDIWGMFIEPVVQASQRYQANVVAMAKILDTGNGVQISAALSIEDAQQWWEASAESVDQAAQLLIDQIGDRVGERYAVQASQDVGEQVVLDVSGVDQLADYARLGEYLDGLLAIRTWHLSLVAGSHHQYRITLESNLEALEQSFRLDRKLVVKPKQIVVPLSSTAEPAPVATEAAETPEQPEPIEQIPVAAPQTAPILYYEWQG